MIEITTTAYMTSKDALELAAKLRDMEKNAALGSDLTAKTWFTETGAPGVIVRVKFVVDQGRARRDGLMQ